MHQLYNDNDLYSIINLSMDVITAMVDAEMTGIF